jgi:hypothetical protein
MKFVLFTILLFPISSFAIDCDCAVMVYSPMTGSNKMPYTVMKKYEGYEFSNYQVQNQLQCRKVCEEKFQEDMPSNRLNALLLTYSQHLIEEGKLGFNCTGLTTLKYPVRVRAKLGNLPLGNVVDIIEVVTHEQVCF